MTSFKDQQDRYHLQKFSGLPPEKREATLEAYAACKEVCEDFLRFGVDASVDLVDVHKVALQTRIARGGDPCKPLEQEEYDEAARALQLAGVSNQTLEQRKDIELEEVIRLEVLKSLLTDKEIKGGQITFARAVALTTGNHDRPRHYRKPARWIAEFRKRRVLIMRFFFRKYLCDTGLIGKVDPKHVRAIEAHLEVSLYNNLKANDLIPLAELASMHRVYSFAWERAGAAFFAAWGQRVRVKKITKKSLVAPGGQSAKAPRGKPKKRRTKSA